MSNSRPSPASALVKAVVRRAIAGKRPADQRADPDTKGSRGVLMRVASKVAGIVYPTNNSGNSMSVR